MKKKNLEQPMADTSDLTSQEVIAVPANVVEVLGECETPVEESGANFVSQAPFEGEHTNRDVQNTLMDPNYTCYVAEFDHEAIPDPDTQAFDYRLATDEETSILSNTRVEADAQESASQAAMWTENSRKLDELLAKRKELRLRFRDAEITDNDATQVNGSLLDAFVQDLIEENSISTEQINMHVDDVFVDDEPEFNHTETPRVAHVDPNQSNDYSRYSSFGVIREPSIPEQISSMFTSPMMYAHLPENDLGMRASWDSPAKKRGYQIKPKTTVKEGWLEKIFGKETATESNLIHDPLSLYGQTGTYAVFTVESSHPLALPGWETAFTNAHYYSGMQFDRIIYPWSKNANSKSQIAKCFGRIAYGKRPTHFTKLQALYKVPDATTATQFSRDDVNVDGYDTSSKDSSKEYYKKKLGQYLILSNMSGPRPRLTVTDVEIKKVTEADIMAKTALGFEARKPKPTLKQRFVAWGRKKLNKLDNIEVNKQFVASSRQIASRKDVEKANKYPVWAANSDKNDNSVYKNHSSLLHDEPEWIDLSND